MYLVLTRMPDKTRVTNVPVVEFMYLVLTRMPDKTRVTVGDSGLCCCVCVTFFEL